MLAGVSFHGRHFHESIFSRGEAFDGSEFQPTSADASGGGFDQLLLLADLAGDLALHISHDPSATFDLDTDDAEAVKGNTCLLWLLRFLRALRSGGGLPRRELIGGIVDLDVERGKIDVGLHGGVSAVEFNGLFRASNRVERAAEDVAFGVTNEVAGGLLDFDDLGFALKAVEQKYTRIFRKTETGGDLRELGFLDFAIVVDFLVELHGFRDGGSGGAVPFEFFGGGPVNERRGEFFPVIALGAHVADAVPFDFILGDELIGAVFEDETAREVLGRSDERPEEECG